MCGNACPAGQVCSNGQCGVNCMAPLVKCGTECVDLTTDEANCGMCGQFCPASVACVNSQCMGAGDCQFLPTCQNCVDCAAEGLCSDEVQTCAAIQECVDLSGCIDMCPQGDQNCVNTCAFMYQNGVQPYINYTECLFCQECPTKCNVDTTQCPIDCDAGAPDCATCQNCALQPTGNCDDDYDTCLATPDCDALLTCLNNCMPGNMMCQDNCFNTFPNGIPGFNSVVLCLSCQECPVSCNGPMQGCP
jgi:hypothetical protein